MSQDYLALIEQSFDAWNRSALDEFDADLLDEEVVWDSRGMNLGGDFDRVFYGNEGVLMFWREWLPAWESIEFEVVWIKQVGDRVVAWGKQRQVGKRSGIPNEVPYAWDFLFRDGKLTRVAFFRDEQQALEAVGLRE